MNKRQLWITRGLPGAGKTEWIERNGLAGHSLSSEFFQKTQKSLVLDDRGKPCWNQAPAELLLVSLQDRMSRGEFTVLDGCHTAYAELAPYLELARAHRFQVSLVDFSEVPYEEILRRNQERQFPAGSPQLDQLRHQMLSGSDCPDCGYLTPEAAEDRLLTQVEDLSEYTRVHHIGDLQGCYEVLQAYFRDYSFTEEDYYIFTGDYVDRGLEHERLLPALLELQGLPNVRFLEGNHERQLWFWATDRLEACSELFREKTLPHLRPVVSKERIRTFCESLDLYIRYEHGGREVVVTHGGLSGMPEKACLLSPREFTNGSGPYASLVDEIFTRNTRDGQYQVHGHRNPNRLPIQAGGRGHCLEGRVEYGGELRVVQLGQDGFVPIEVPNRSYLNRAS